MQKCKIKSLEEVTQLRDTTLKEIKRDFCVQTVLMIILVIIALIVCFKSMILARDYDILNQEKQALERLTETQSSMIADLEENLRELFIQIEDSKEGVVHGRNLEGY